jgi:hypothetical protein
MRILLSSVAVAVLIGWSSIAGAQTRNEFNGMLPSEAIDDVHTNYEHRIHRIFPPEPLLYNGDYNVKDFGAKGDGITDDTAFIMAAYAKAATDLAANQHGGGGAVYFPPSSGCYKFSTLNLPSGGGGGWIVSRFDNGLCGNTIEAGNWNAFIGLSGNFQGLGSVFVFAPNTTWTNTTDQSAPLLDLKGVEAIYLEGINIECVSSSACIHIHDNAGTGTVWVTINKSVVGNNSSGSDILADASSASTVSGFGLRINQSSIPGPNTISLTNFGQVHLWQCFTGSGSISMTNAGIPSNGDLVFEDVLSEGLNRQDFAVVGGNYVEDITFRDVKLADPVGTVYMFNNQTTGNPYGPVRFDMAVSGNIGSGLMNPSGIYANVSCQGAGCPSYTNVGSTAPVIVGNLPSASANPFAMIPVTDSTTIFVEGQSCAGGSSNKALAFSNGISWKCL